MFPLCSVSINAFYFFGEKSLTTIIFIVALQLIPSDPNDNLAWGHVGAHKKELIGNLLPLYTNMVVMK